MDILFILISIAIFFFFVIIILRCNLYIRKHTWRVRDRSVALNRIEPVRAERRKYSRTELTMISMIQAFQDNKAGMRGREGVSNACIIAFHERFGGPWLSLPVISSQNMQVKIKNISLGGAFILCKKPLPSHEYFNLVFTTHNNKTFLLNAKAVWSNIGTNRKKSIPSGSGIRFLKISEDDKRRLGEVIEGEIVS